MSVSALRRALIKALTRRQLRSAERMGLAFLLQVVTRQVAFVVDLLLVVWVLLSAWLLCAKISI